ncbi:MAG TPA: hypothetical protein EYG98_02195 [Sulfurovum sp.]|nr:hypothetical protein [Sulfurovum sp.]
MKNLLVLFVFLWLSACSIKQASLKVYTLDIPQNSTVSSSRLRAKTIKVTYPRSIEEKSNSKMRYSYSNAEQGTYNNSQWSNDIGKLLQGTLIQVLEESRLFRAVIPYASTIKEDYRLESNIFDFSHHVRGEASYAIVSIQFNLIDIDSGRLIKSKRFSYREMTPTTDAKGYVDATNKAISRLSRDLIVWIRY